MNDLTSFQQQAVTIAISKMLSERSFNICTLDAIAKVIGVTPGGPDYAALRTLHCVEFADMGRDVARQVREKCLELLGVPPTIIEQAMPAQPEPEPEPHDVRRHRLAFWRAPR